jgi:zinc protease
MRLGVLSLLLLVPSTGWAQLGRALELDVYELDNGLKVILAPNREATTVSVDVWYDAGSRREPIGRSGFAHLFEHLMFQGSDNVAPGEHSSLITRAGGAANAYLIVDNTGFFETLPPDRYNLGLWLEAERMRSLVITEENLRREIEVVKEERRLRSENAPYGMAQLESLFNLPYNQSSCFSYGHSQIGSPEDLDASTLADVRHFFETYYVPNNATLTLAGAFDPAQARGLIQQYFGGIPRSPEPVEVSCVEPFSHLPVRSAMTDVNARLPGVMYTYGTIPARHPDTDVLNLLMSILAEGESSRLNQKLVREEQVAVQTTGFNWERLGPGVAWIFAVANQGVDVDRVETVLDEAIDQVRREGVTQAELDKARNNYLAGAVRERQTANGTAEALQWANHFLGDPRQMEERMRRLMTINVGDVQRVANTYLRPENRAVVTVDPATGGAN